MTEVGEELVALHLEPGPCVDPLRVTEVRVSLHGQSVCQHLLTVLGVLTRRATRMCFRYHQLGRSVLVHLARPAGTYALVTTV